MNSKINVGAKVVEDLNQTTESSYTNGKGTQRTKARLGDCLKKGKHSDARTIY
jgi:hypothetical protein